MLEASLEDPKEILDEGETEYLLSLYPVLFPLPKYEATP